MPDGTTLGLLQLLQLLGEAPVVSEGPDPRLALVRAQVEAGPAPAGGTTEWDVEIEAPADRDVTNNAVLGPTTAHPELKFSCPAGSIWKLELLLLYAGNNAASDFKMDLVLPTATGWFRYVGDSSTADAILVNTGTRLAAALAMPAISLGTDALLTPRTLLLEGMFRAGGAVAADVQLRWANAAAAAARISRVVESSVLRGKRLK